MRLNDPRVAPVLERAENRMQRVTLLTIIDQADEQGNARIADALLQADVDGVFALLEGHEPPKAADAERCRRVAERLRAFEAKLEAAP